MYGSGSLVNAASWRKYKSHGVKRPSNESIDVNLARAPCPKNESGDRLQMIDHKCTTGAGRAEVVQSPIAIAGLHLF